MNPILSDLAASCSALLTESPRGRGPKTGGGIIVGAAVRPGEHRLLVPPSTGERDLLFQDPELGFCILAHVYDSPKTSSPHDHGPSWAIYAQARGETEMTDFELLSEASDSVPGTVRATRTYRLQPGDAHVYNEGDLHAAEA